MTGSAIVEGQQYFDAQTSKLVKSGMTANTDLYQNTNGTYTKKVFADSVNYQTAAGTWTPINTNLVANSTAKGSRSRPTRYPSAWPQRLPTHR